MSGGPATAAAAAAAAAATATEEVAVKDGPGPGIDSDALFKAFTDKDLGFHYAKLTCATNEVFTVLRCSEGNWLLVKTLAGFATGV